MVEDIIIDVIEQIEQASNDQQKCWEIALKGADNLYFFKNYSIDSLIQLLSSPGQKVVLLAMFYLGTLNEMGLDATRAVEPIRRVLAYDDTPTVVGVATMSLAALGVPSAAKKAKKAMRAIRIHNARERRRASLALVLNLIRKGRP